jgi:NAD(P)-dependent dehydrogenase (short-subunit alcohol dehydrogenase family)
MKIIKKKYNLKKKKIFVLGGSGLIGSEVCKEFSEFEANITNLDVIEKKTKYKNYRFVYFDISDFKNLDLNILKIIKKYGCPDVFINCSYPKTNDWQKNNFLNIKLESFNRNINLQLTSSSWILKIFADKMKKNKKSGSIIQLSSIYGLVGQNLNIYENTNITENLTYSVVKGGQSNLVKQMASYYGKYKIRINAVCAGGVFDKQNKIFVKNYSKQVPIKRMAKAHEISSTIIFLSSDASSYITGSNLVVDGGWTSI